MTTEAKPQLSLREKAAILKEHGIDVIDCMDRGWVDVDKTVYQGHRAIFFDGGEKEGEKAVQIFHEHGIPVFAVSQHWTYFRRIGQCADVRWELSL